MNATQEWLRYIESKAIKQLYDIKDSEDDSEQSEQSTTDCVH